MWNEIVKANWIRASSSASMVENIASLMAAA